MTFQVFSRKSRFPFLVIMALGLAGEADVGPSIWASQQPSSIYPVYDGYIENADGTLTLSFAYFSHNRIPITIPVGPDNAFAPGPADRGQPITFLPGHHRWQCIVVVDEVFDGDLRWSLSHQGETNLTSESMLQYNWELDVNGVAAVNRGFDRTAAPRGACVNRPPIVRVLGYGGRRGPHELHVAVGDELKLFGSVRDEGLPRGGELTARWRVVSGPGEVMLEDAENSRTRAVFSEPGRYQLELTGSDSLLSDRVRVTVIVV